MKRRIKDSRNKETSVNRPPAARAKEALRSSTAGGGSDLYSETVQEDHKMCSPQVFADPVRPFNKCIFHQEDPPKSSC